MVENLYEITKKYVKNEKNFNKEEWQLDILIIIFIICYALERWG